VFFVNDTEPQEELRQRDMLKWVKMCRKCLLVNLLHFSLKKLRVQKGVLEVFSTTIVLLKNPEKGFGLAAVGSYSLFNGNYEKAFMKTAPINQRQ
jgi:hypothetical protein